MAAGFRSDDLYASGAFVRRRELAPPMTSLEPGDTLVVCTIERLGRKTAATAELASWLKDHGLNLRVLNLGGEVVDTATARGFVFFAMLVAMAGWSARRSWNAPTIRRPSDARPVQGWGGRRQMFSDRRIERSRTIIGG